MFNKSTRLILGCFLLIEGILLTFGLPPFQKNDEVVHFNRTVALSYGQLFCQNGHFVIPKVYENLPQNYNFQKVLLSNEKFPISLIDFNKKWQKQDLQEKIDVGACSLKFFGYIPNSLGIWLTSWTNRPAVIFYAGRLFGLAFLIMMLIASLRIINKKYEYLLWFYALMPMVLHQVTAFSYDVVILSLILPLTALWLNQLSGQKLNKKNWIWIFLMISIMTILKPVYLPLFFLFGIKDWSWKFKIKEIIAVFLICLLFLGIGQIGKGKGGSYPTFVNPKLQLRLVINDPLYFSEVIFRSWTEKTMPHIEEIVAVMGWRNIKMENNYINFVFIILAVWVTNRLAKDFKNKIGFREIIQILTIIFIVMFLSTTAMFLLDSIVGTNIIEGIQGRYWLPLIPCWLIVISGLINFTKEKVWFKNLILILVLTGIVVNINQSLWNRYFDWSKYQINKLDPKMESDGLIIIDKDFSLIKESQTKNISGLVLNFDNRNKSITIPYQYKIMDENCKKTLRYGYLKFWDIQGETQMELNFKPIVVTDKRLCLKLIPMEISNDDYQDKLTIKTTNNNVQMEWLYFNDK